MSSYYRLLNRLQGIKLQFKGLGFYLSLVVLSSFVAGIFIYHSWLQFDSPVITQDIMTLNKLKSDLRTQRNVLAKRDLELKLAKEANVNMQQMFSEEIQQKIALERELAFYRSIMAPEDYANGVAIHGLELEPGLVINQFRLKLILTQLKKIKKPLNGHIDITLVGKMVADPYEMKLDNLIPSKLKFNYRYFQVVETDFVLPDDFKLDRLVVNVVVPKTRWTKGSRSSKSYNVSELLIEKDSRVLLEQTSQVTDNLVQQTM